MIDQWPEPADIEIQEANGIAVNLHNNPYPSFENRVCIALAAGHLVISESLSPQKPHYAGKVVILADEVSLSQGSASTHIHCALGGAVELVVG